MRGIEIPGLQVSLVRVLRVSGRLPGWQLEATDGVA